MPAKPNYEFAKRQKEQAKQKKKEEKRLKKLQSGNDSESYPEQSSEQNSDSEQA